MSGDGVSRKLGNMSPGQSLRASRRRALTPLVALFLIFISLPLADSVIRFSPKRTLRENRVLAPKPRFRWGDLRGFSRNFEDYYADHFGTRSVLVRWASRFKLRVLRVSPKPAVVLGRQGWLFFGEEDPNRNVMDYHRGLKPFTEAELVHWKSVLTERRDWLKRRGIGYLLVVVPDKSTIYPEYLPASLRSGVRPCRRVQLLSYLRAHADLPLLDLTPSLEGAKKERLLYLKTDTHWNSYGAFVAYRELLRRLAARFPALSPAPLSDFILLTTEQFGGDLAMMVNGRDILRDEGIRLLPKQPRKARSLAVPLPPRAGVEWSASEHPDRGLPRAVMFLDSFGFEMKDFLSEHFSRIFYVRDQDLAFDADPVMREKPDLVIDELNERFLLGWMPQNPTAMRR